MATQARSRPYIWVSWLTSLIAGDLHCQWAAWFKAHHTYDKLPPENENALSKWKSYHAEMVRRASGQLESAGWTVHVESQNKFHYAGRVATVGGCPDIIAAVHDTAHVVDCKSGREREADFWQVATYALLAPLISPTAKLFEDQQGLPLLHRTGAVVYKARTREIAQKDLEAGYEHVIAQVNRTASPEEPKRVPSWTECRYCDIPDCPDRVREDALRQEIEPAKGVLF